MLVFLRVCLEPDLLCWCLQVSDAGQWTQVEVKMENGVVCDGGGSADCSGQQQQWQINLLDHIDSVQDEVTHRMDFIERELDGETQLMMPNDEGP